MTSFQSKVIAVTGAASGMGLATAKMLASRGATVSLADMSKDGLEAAVKSLSGSGHMSSVIDVRDSKLVDSWIERTVERFGKLDGAVNMAGIVTWASPIAETTNEAYDFNMDVNAKGVFYCLRAELRNIKPGGSIVSAASVYGRVGMDGLGAYTASKHAVVGLTKCAAKEQADTMVRVNCIAPGVVNTAMTQDESPEDVKKEMSQQVLQRMVEPEEVANLVCFLLSDDSRFITGAVYNIDGGWVT